MSKFWYVALNEYKRHVLKKSFILAIFSVPLLLGVSILAGVIAGNMFMDDRPVGYVDHANVLTEGLPVPAFDEEDEKYTPVEIIAYPDDEAAMQALDAGTIQAIFTLPADYLFTRQVTVTFYETPGENAEDDFTAFLRANLSEGLSPILVERALKGFDLTIRTPDGGREFSERRILNLILPIVAGFIFTFILSSSSGYLTSAVAEEKENRTIEVLATSMSSNQFITGKVLGIVLVVLTQITSWLLFFVLAYHGAKDLFDVDWLQSASIDPGLILILVGLFVPAFFFYAGLALTISSTVSEVSEGQQAVGLISMPLSFSYFLAVAVVLNPASPISITLSMLPFTAPTIMPLRVAFSEVPPEQMLICIGLMSLSAVFTIWLSARAYDLGMLRFGQRIRMNELLRNHRKERQAQS